MKRNILSAIIILTATSGLFAQGQMDALRYSYTLPQGTARSLSMGNAFGALGGDFSSLSINPAGLGVYRSSEFVFSGGYNINNVNSSFLNNSDNEFTNKFSINTIGFIGTYKSGQDDGWVSTSFGIGYNRLYDFNKYAVISGLDTIGAPSSMVNYFFNNVYDGNGNVIQPDNLDPYYERLAYDSYVIDYDTSNGEYISDVPYGVLHRNTIDQKGSGGEYLLSFGANYSNVFYIGGALSIYSFNFEQNNLYREEDSHNLSSNFDWFTFNTWNKARGTGYSFKIGAIVKPVQFIRLGLAYHLPVSYSVTDEFLTSMQSNYVNYTVYPTNQDGSLKGSSTSTYKLITPGKLVLSGALQFQNYGLFSVDAEYTNYSRMRLQNSGSGYDFYDENNIIKKIYKPALNIKAGAEGRIGSIAIRGGYNIYGSPYAKSEINKNAFYQTLSCGIGYRLEKIYIDLAYVRQLEQEKYYMYTDNFLSPATLKNDNSKIILTLGLKF